MTTQRFAAKLLVALATATVCLSLVVTSAGAGQDARVSDDPQLHYEEAVHGPVMVLVPGWTASTTVFSHQLEHFSKHYRVIT